MNMKSILTLSASMLVLSNCAAPLIIGGGAAVGTMAIKDKGISGTMNDSSINATIDAQLLRQSVDIFTKVDVDVYMGEVLLTGFVNQPEQSLDAEKAAWKADGVRAVYNHINIGENTFFPNYMSDSWITTRIKGKLLAEKSVQSFNFFIKTVNGVVFVMGTAEAEKEINLVKSLISSTNGVQEIMNYAIIKEMTE